MPPTKADVSKLLGTLYDAAGDASLWPRFLEELGRATQSTQSAILLHDLDHRIALQWGLDAAAVQSYSEHFGARDLWLQKSVPFIHEGWLATSEEVCLSEELGRSEFYNDYLKPNNIAHAMWGVLENSPSRIINVGLYRDRRRPFAGKDLELLRFLSPQIKRAFRLHLQLSDLKAQADNLQHALDRVATAVILLGSAGRVIHTNWVADKLLAESDGLKVVHGRLKAEHSREANDLEQLISQAQATSLGTGLGGGGAIKISRRAGPPLHALVTPARNISLDSAAPLCAIVFVNGPLQKVRPAAEVLQVLFDFTPAESRLALLLCDGYSPPEIADLIGVSANTLKTQLASIYRKTRTSRQSQLVRLLANLSLVAAPR